MVEDSSLYRRATPWAIDSAPSGLRFVVGASFNHRASPCAIDIALSGLGFVVGSSFNHRASPWAIDSALSGLSLWHTLNKKSSEGATSTAQSRLLSGL